MNPRTLDIRIAIIAATLIGLTASAVETKGQRIPGQDIRIQQPKVDPRLRNIRIPLALAQHTVIASGIADAFWSPSFNEIALSGAGGGSVYGIVTGNTVSLPGTPLGFDNDGSRMLLRTGTDSTLVWGLSTRSVIRSVFRSGSIGSFSNDGGRIVVGPGGSFPAGNGITRVWSVATGQELFKLGSNFSGSFNDPNQVLGVNVTRNPEFSPDGARLLVLHSQGNATANSVDAPTRAEIYNTSTWARLVGISMSPDDDIRFGRFSRDNTRILVAGSRVQIHDASNGAMISRMLVGSPINSVEFNSNGSQILTATHDAKYQVWNASTGALIRTIEQVSGVSTSSLYTASFSPNGSRIMTVVGNRVRIWSAADGTLLQTFDHNSMVRVARWRPSGDGILTIEIQGGRVHTWRVG